MVLIVMAAWWWWGSSGGVEIGGGNKVSEVKSTIRLVRVPVSASCLKSGAGVCVLGDTTFVIISISLQPFRG